MIGRKLICVALAVLCVLALGLSGCAAKYHMDYDGNKSAYFGAQDEYEVGQTVELYYMFVAVDTDYSFTLDGKALDAEYVEGKGYRFSFTMPAHDAVLRCEAKPSDAYNPYPTGEMVLDFYYKPTTSDTYDELVLYGYSSKDVTLCVYFASMLGEETRVDYMIPIEIANECFLIIRENKVDSWATASDSSALEDAEAILKYRRDDGGYVRVSTEDMPEGGEQVFDRIRTLLEGCEISDYII